MNECDVAKYPLILFLFIRVWQCLCRWYWTGAYAIKLHGTESCPGYQSTHTRGWIPTDFAIIVIVIVGFTSSIFDDLRARSSSIFCLHLSSSFFASSSDSLINNYRTAHDRRTFELSAA